MFRGNSNDNPFVRYEPATKLSLSILEPGGWVVIEAIKDYNVELNKDEAKELIRGMGAGNKIRCEVKEKETEEGGETKTKMMIRLIRTFGRPEKGHR